MNDGKFQYILSSDPCVFIHIVSCALSQGATEESICYCIFIVGAHCILEVGGGQALKTASMEVLPAEG